MAENLSKYTGFSLVRISPYEARITGEIWVKEMPFVLGVEIFILLLEFLATHNACSFSRTLLKKKKH